MDRCLVCGCSRYDARGIGCALCGKALGPRWEQCYVAEDTKAKLLSHSQKLSQLGVEIEQVSPLQKDAKTTIAVTALALSMAESLDHGALRKLVVYLRQHLSLPRNEILRLRLAEPEDVDEVLSDGDDAQDTR